MESLACVYPLKLLLGESKMKKNIFGAVFMVSALVSSSQFIAAKDALAPINMALDARELYLKQF